MTCPRDDSRLLVIRVVVGCLAVVVLLVAAWMTVKGLPLAERRFGAMLMLVELPGYCAGYVLGRNFGRLNRQAKVGLSLLIPADLLMIAFIIHVSRTGPLPASLVPLGLAFGFGMGQGRIVTKARGASRTGGSNAGDIVL